MSLKKTLVAFQGFNWRRFIQGVLSSVSLDVELEEEVVIYGSPYLDKMNEVLARHSVRSAKGTRAKNKKSKESEMHQYSNASSVQNYAELSHLAAGH